MATTIELEKWRKDLQASFPVFGGMKRRGAMQALEQRTNEPEVIPLLAEALGHSDAEIAARAGTALKGLHARPAVDALCELAEAAPTGPVARLCIEKGYRPSVEERDALFLFVTRQLDLYFKEYDQDHFETLRREYDRAKPAIRDLVMEVVRSGDVRCLPFIQRPRKTLQESTEAEIKLAIQSCLRHRDWPGLFRLCLELPLKYSFPALAHFRDCGWEPEKPELKSLFKQVLADQAGQTVEPPPVPKAASSVFERWLEQGRSGELAQASEADLVKRLQTAIPPEGVSIVSALARTASVSPPTVEAVAKNEHWLVRLAGLATGLTKDIMKDIGTDSNYWVNELAGAAGVLEFWPMKASPADLQRLENAPPEAYAGKLGAARKVLKDIVGYHRGGDVIVEPIVLKFGEADVEIVVES